MNDTIAAISTAPGPGLRAVVRISGPRAFAVARGLTAGGPQPDALRGFSMPSVSLDMGSGRTVRARMLIMRGPRSYTTEDTVEIHLTGAPPLAGAVLYRCLAFGARLAGPGEFTRRAYLGGRIDAAQVEGVLGLIESRNREEQSASLELLRGGTLREAAAVRRSLMHVLAAIEAYLDFTDEDTERVERNELLEVLRSCLRRLDRIEQRLERRVPFRNLPRVVILGPPNAGKSTLFKALVPRSRALTSPTPGTTRDLLEGEVRFSGRRIFLYDAPGIASSRDPLERLALSTLSGAMARMDAALVVLDRSVAPPGRALARISGMSTGRPRRYVLNKCDLPPHPEWAAYRFEESPLEVSAAEGSGLEALLLDLLPLLPPPAGAGGASVDLQTLQSIRSSRQAVREALEGDWEGGLELVAMEIREATDAIGLLSGPVTDEEILDCIFSRFCIGK